MRDLQDEYGISPAVGVILLLGITAALATIAGIVLLDIGDGLTQNAQAGVSVTETPEGVEVSWNTDSTAEQIIVQANGQRYTLNSVNDSITLGLNEGSNVSVIGVINGEESVISETTTESDTGDGTVKNYNPGSTETLSGTVSVNPNIEGAEVRVVKNDTVITTTTTDSSGTYSVEAPEQSRIEVVVEDFTYDSGSKTFYGSAVRDVGSDFSSSLDVDFTEPSSTTTVNGDSILVRNESYNGTKTIGSVEQLQSINSDVSSDYMLLNDIDASETSSWNSGSGFEPIGGPGPNVFTGNFNGNNYTIDQLVINRNSETFVGLFAYADETNIENVKLTNIDMTGDIYTGGLIGQSTNSEITNSTIIGELNSNTYTGGLVGKDANLSITNSNVDINISGGVDSTGGLIGAGENDGSISISGSHAEGTITGGNVGSTGGLLGNGAANITDSYVNATITGSSNGGSTGGLIGQGNGSVTNSYSTGNVTGNNGSTGGIAGAGFNVTDSYVTGDVEGKNSGPTGGLVGQTSEVSNSYVTGSVTGQGSPTGGLVGTGVTTITNSYVTGSVTGTTYTGGLLGSTGNTITNSYATGDISGGSNSTGGLVGEGISSITNSYAANSVTGSGSTGGLLGGSSFDEITNSYWNTELSGITTAKGSEIGLTTSEMEGNNASNNMSAFDFNNTWTTTDSYPKLRE